MEELRLNDARNALELAVGWLNAERDSVHDRTDPRGRHLSIAITHIEDAMLRVDLLIEAKAKEAQ